MMKSDSIIMMRWKIRKLIYFSPFYLSLATPALIAIVSIFLWTFPYDGLNWSSRYEIIKVDPEGPGAKAGLYPGDVIVELDGVPIAQVSPLYEKKKAGDAVSFSILRGDEIKTIELILEAPSFHILVVRLEPLFVAFSFWLVSTIILAFKPSAREVRLFFLVSQFGAIGLAIGAISAFLLQEWAGRLFVIISCLLSPLLIHFHFIFPSLKFTSRKRLAIKMLYGIGLILSSPYALLSISQLRAISIYPILRNIVMLYFSLSILVSIASLAHTYITAPLERRRIRLIFLGTAFAFSPLVILSILPEVVMGSPLLSYELSFPFLVIIPLSYSYAVYKQRLWRIDLILNRSVVYFIIGIIWACLYLASVIALDYLLPSAAIGRPLLGALVTLVMASFFAPIKGKIQALVDRAFYGGWYDYKSVIGDVSKSLSRALDESELSKLLVMKVSETMRLKGAALFLRDGKGNLVLREKVGFEGGLPISKIKGNGALARFLGGGEPIEAAKLRRKMRGSEIPFEEKALLDSEQVRLWLPLAFKGKLGGLLLLGAREVEDFFGEEDVRILGTLAQQAGIACENVRLIEELKRKIKELANVKRELGEAHQRLLTGREEERKKLSRELHDGIVQELTNLYKEMKEWSGMPLSEIKVKLEGAGERLSQLANEVRRICAGLRPVVLDALGLADAIRDEADKFTSRTGIETNVTVEGNEEMELSEEVEITLFRALQEALRNVEKHSRAREVDITLKLPPLPEAVSLVVRDDGRGFVVPSRLGKFVDEGRFGLVSIRERVRLAGGFFSISSKPGCGTSFEVRMPFGIYSEECASAH
jgi:two-component system sensor histidine kinase ComP